MKKLEEQPAMERVFNTDQAAEFLLEIGLGEETWTDVSQVIGAAVEKYAEVGNRIYEEYYQLKMDEFGDYRLSSDRARQVRANNFRQEHCDRPLADLREKYIRGLMPIVDETALRQQLQDINFPLE